MGCDAAERTSKTNATGLQIERGSGAKDQFVGQCARLRISLIIDVRGIGSIVRGVIFDVRMFSSRAELGNSVGERSGEIRGEQDKLLHRHHYHTANITRTSFSF